MKRFDKLASRCRGCLSFDQRILVVPSDHPWTKRARIYPDELINQPIILMEEPVGVRVGLFEALRKHTLSSEILNITMELDNAESIIMAVEEGIGIAFLSRLSAQRDLMLGKIKKIFILGMDLKRDIFMIRNKSQNSTLAQQVFWDFIGSQKGDDL